MWGKRKQLGEIEKETEGGEKGWREVAGTRSGKRMKRGGGVSA